MFIIITNIYLDGGHGIVMENLHRLHHVQVCCKRATLFLEIA